MKKSILLSCAAVSGLLLMAGCAKEVKPCSDSVNLSEPVPFELTLSLNDTKTTIDAQFKETWVKGDSISVFHAATGSSDYVNDGAFVALEDGEAGVFAGSLQSPLVAGQNYDWYIIYPYSEETVSPQTAVFRINRGYEVPDSGENVNLKGLPLWSNAKNVDSGSALAFQMHHAFSIAKMTMTNVNLSAMSIENFKISAEEKNKAFKQVIVPSGDAYLDVTGENVSVTSLEGGYNPKHVTIHYDKSWDMKLKKGESFTLYFPIIPQVLPAESSFMFTPNSEAGKIVSFLEPFEFKAGEIRTFNVTLDKDQMYMTEKEAADTVRFRFCIDNDQLETIFLDGSSKGFWQNRKTDATLVSVYDHCNLNIQYIESYGEKTYFPRAYIKINEKQTSNPKFAGNENRYYLATGQLVKDNSFSVVANFANLAAGKKVVFHTSFFIGLAASSCKTYECSYSVDGGKNFVPANAVVEAAGDTAVDGVVTFSTAGDYECHPLVLSTDALASAIEKGSVIFKIKLVDDSTEHVGFAPYYKFDGTVKKFTEKIGGGMNNIEGCAYITVE